MNVRSAGWEHQGTGEAFFIFGSALLQRRDEPYAGSMTRADSRAMSLCSHIHVNFHERLVQLSMRSIDTL